MAYTEKVSLSGTALSFLLYECVNSVHSQEGFLIGDVTSEITNHISDLQSDTARLDTQILIRTILPLPLVSLFYQPTGKIKEEALNELLSSSASEIVGWYKFRRNNNIKPTFRDKLITKGLQKYFDKYHGKKNFVTCSLTNKVSVIGSTHTFTYRFGKINCFDMYEYIDDVTANLGEKLTGYKKAHRHSPHSIFNSIISKNNVQSNNPTDAILHIQEAVNAQLRVEAKLAAKNEHTIRDLELEIKQMTSMLAEKHAVVLHASNDKILKEKIIQSELGMAKACAEALRAPSESHIDISTFLLDGNHVTDRDQTMLAINDNRSRSPSPLPPALKNTVYSYAETLKKTNKNLSSAVASSSKSKDLSEDLINFDIEETASSNKFLINDDATCFGENSPEY